MRFHVSLALLLAFAHSALADDYNEAKVHFKKGSAHFAIGEFAEAAEEYQAAYRLKQDPALLYNAAQAFRLAGKNEKALHPLQKLSPVLSQRVEHRRSARPDRQTQRSYRRRREGEDGASDWNRRAEELRGEHDAG